MASVTVTNLQATAMNELDSLTGGVGVSALLAVGGARKDPLPHPFSHVELEATGGADASTLSVHQRDWRHKGFAGHNAMEAGEEWNMLVQAGKVSLSFASSDGDVEDGAEAEY
jgi:hypothetical protein